jgi:ATP-dependent helicase HepA
MIKEFKIGQRWISTMEPELGLGVVIEVEPKKVQINFSTSNIQRFYSIDNNPLKRICFRVGDEIKSVEGACFQIEEVREDNGLLYYIGEGIKLVENEISDSISFVSATERLLAGHVDSKREFQFRAEMLNFNYQYYKSITKGFIGPRVNIIPHQFYIAEEAVSRKSQRMLLADEVGLGKTIEACLIVHYLLMNRRIERVLIIVPDSLIYQWFVELLRKFNLSFNILDKAFFNSDESRKCDHNIFEDQQLILTSMEAIFSGSAKSQDILNSKWDFVIVDEVHHLEKDSQEYEWLQKLTAETQDVLLLTATPEMLGYRTLFDLCHLLYPDIYFSFEKFVNDAEKYVEIADIIDKIDAEKELAASELSKLQKKLLLPHAELNRIRQAGGIIQASNRKQTVEKLLDGYGLGRIIFRNTRKNIGFYTKRNLHLIPLSFGKKTDHILDTDSIFKEFNDDNDIGGSVVEYSLKDDLRIIWLVDFIKEEKERKVLLICHSKEKAMAIQKAVMNYININIALFHEKMTLIQRDRMAAYFAKEDGAQLLICSEIGSEGRNFQFSQHLVCFDCPLNIELLEQRVGRLDRIGQQSEIHIHVPYLKDSIQEIINHWLVDGCHAFISSLIYGNRIIDIYRENIINVIQKYNEKKLGSDFSLDELIKETDICAAKLTEELEAGRDRLLELNAYRLNSLNQVANQIQDADKDISLEKFMLKLFEYYDVQVEETSKDRTWWLSVQGDYTEVLPGFRGNKMLVTFNREVGLKREDILFLTWDSPMVRGVIDLFLGSEQGNASIASWEDEDDENVYLEVIYIVECIAPNSLHIDRFLSAQPIRVLVDAAGNDFTKDFSVEYLAQELVDMEDEMAVKLLPLLTNQYQDMLIDTETVANPILDETVEQSRETMNLEYEAYIKKYRYLKKINHHIRDEDISNIENERDMLDKYLLTARLRLDSVRMILKGSLS